MTVYAGVEHRVQEGLRDIFLSVADCHRAVSQLGDFESSPSQDHRELIRRASIRLSMFVSGLSRPQRSRFTLLLQFESACRMC